MREDTPGVENTEGNRETAGRTVTLIPRLKEDYHMLTSAFRAGTGGKFLQVKDLTALVDAVEERRELKLGKTLTLDFATDTLDETAKGWFDYINRYVQDERSRQYGFTSRYGEGNPKQQIPLRASYLDEFFDLGLGREVTMAEGNGSGNTEVSLRETEPKLSLRIEAKKDDRGNFDGITLTGNLPEIFNGAKYQYILRDRELCRISGKGFKAIRPLFHASRGEELNVTIGRRNLSGFYHNILPVLQETCQLSSRMKT